MGILTEKAVWSAAEQPVDLRLLVDGAWQAVGEHLVIGPARAATGSVALEMSLLDHLLVLYRLVAQHDTGVDIGG